MEDHCAGVVPFCNPGHIIVSAGKRILCVHGAHGAIGHLWRF